MRGRGLEATIQRQTAVDDFDGTGGDWETFAEVYADIRPLRGNEQFNAAQVQSHVTHFAETEFVDGVTSQMRLKVPRPEMVNLNEPAHDDNFRFFEIESAINVNEVNRSLEMMVVEKV